MVSLTISFVLLLELCVASLVLAAPGEKCSFNQAECSIDCPESIVLDLHVLKNEYMTFQPSHHSNSLLLSKLFDCNEQSHFEWYFNSELNLQVKVLLPESSHVDVGFVCYSDFALRTGNGMSFVVKY